jgi:hypothetical protein
MRLNQFKMFSISLVVTKLSTSQKNMDTWSEDTTLVCALNYININLILIDLFSMAFAITCLVK